MIKLLRCCLSIVEADAIFWNYSVLILQIEITTFSIILYKIFIYLYNTL